MELSALKELGIDTEAGMACCADDPEFYEEMLREFVSESEKGIPELDRYYEAGDWENYRIRAHTVKSTSRMIGAPELSEQARRLETAAKEGDAGEITASHAGMRQAFRALIAGLKEALGE